MFRSVWRMRVVAKGMLIATVLVTSSCSRPASTPPQTTSVNAARIASHCTDVAAPSLGPGTMCYQNGFKITQDNFSFPNWGRSTKADDNVTAQTLIDLFGYDTACAPGPATECTLRPTAVQILEMWNTALAGGRCEGLAALSARLHLSLEAPDDFGDTSIRTAQISRRDSNVNQSIVYWWATQFVKEVKRSAADSRRKSPLSLVEQLIQGLANSLGYTIGLYYQSQGHSVTPFAVTNRDEHFVIHVYDNNFPNKRREILVNKNTDTWTYLNASTSIDGTPIDWTGKIGSLELTSMSSRRGPLSCPFCTIVNDDTPSLISLASRDPQNPGFLRITSRKGTAEFTPFGFTSSIAGATVDIGKGSGGLVTVQLPADVTEFDVFVTSPTSSSTTGDVLLSIDRPGFARTQIAGNLARATSTDSKPLAIARKNSIVVTAPIDSSVDVSLAQNGSLITAELDPATEYEISRSSKTDIEVSIKGSLPSQSLTIPIAPSTVSQRASIHRSPQNDLEIEVAIPTSVRARPQRVVNFIPRKSGPKKTTTTTLPSIEISEPD